MYFAVGEQQVIQGFGLPAAIVIIALVAVIMYREIKYWPKVQSDLQLKVDGIQEERLKNALETRDKLTEPIEEMTRTVKNIYEAVLRNPGK